MQRQIETKLVGTLVLALLVVGSSCVGHLQKDVALIYSSLASNEDPPVVEFQVSGDGVRGFFEGRGQAIVLNGKFLTAAHVLPEIQGIDSSASLRALSRQVGYKIAKSGECSNDESFRTSAQAGRLSYEMISCDWAMGSIDELRSGKNSTVMLPYTGKLDHGARVSLVRSSSDGHTIQRFDTRVMIPESSEKFPPSLVFLAKPRGFDHHGWSGCFVGKRVGGCGWMIIGVLSASPTAVHIDSGESLELLVAVRPPIEAMNWFLGNE